MSSSTLGTVVERSSESFRFQTVVRDAALPGVIPRRLDINYPQLRALRDWVAIVEPNASTSTLKFAEVGAGLTELHGAPLLGSDYLDLVDPAIKGDAFDSTFVMLSRPCGLWQVTPALTKDGEEFLLEYTGFPIFDYVRGCGQILFLIGPYDMPMKRIARVQHARHWKWLDMRGFTSPA